MPPAKSAKAGAGEEIRTPDPRITNALLYQLSYAGTRAQHRTFAFLVPARLLMIAAISLCA